jgi:Protein of unknown function (DUF3632)
MLTWGHDFLSVAADRLRSNESNREDEEHTRPFLAVLHKIVNRHQTEVEARNSGVELNEISTSSILSSSSSISHDDYTCTFSRDYAISTTSYGCSLQQSYLTQRESLPFVLFILDIQLARSHATPSQNTEVSRDDLKDILGGLWPPRHLPHRTSLDYSFESPLYLHESPIVCDVLDILLSYLGDKLSCTVRAARALTDLFDRVTVVRAHEDEDVALQKFSDVHYIWTSILWLIKKTPPEHERQQRLLDLVLEIRDSPVPEGSDAVAIYQYYHPNGRYWADMPLLHFNLENFEKISPTHEFGSLGDIPLQTSPRGAELTCDEWSNVNAFITKIHASVDVHYFDLLGLHALIDCLEYAQDPELLDCLLPSAVGWLLYAGYALRANANTFARCLSDYNLEGRGRVLWNAGELYRKSALYKEASFTLERWDFWFERLEYIKGRGDLNGKSRELANSALNLMLEVEIRELQAHSDVLIEVPMESKEPLVDAGEG